MDPVSSPRPFRLTHGRTNSHPPQSIPWASFSSRILSPTPSNHGLVPPSSVIISASNPPTATHELSTSYRLPLSLNFSRSHHHTQSLSFSDTANNIRERTVLLSSLAMSSPPSPSEDDFSTSAIPIDEQSLASTSVSPTTQAQIKSSSPPKSAYKLAGPSSLTLQLQRHSNPSSTQQSREVSPIRPDPKNMIPEMTPTTPSVNNGEDTPAISASRAHQKALQHLSRIHVSPVLPTDITPLLANDSLPTYMGAHPSGADSVPRPDHRRTKPLGKQFRLAVGSTLANAKMAAKPSFWNSLLRRSFLALPAVFLGLLLNVLDGVSYGMILFPAGKIFHGFGPMGVSMFFVTTIVAQIVYTFGGSSFLGGNGSMMIEVVPFFNIMTTQIIDIMGEDDPNAVIATTLAAFSFSAILTGAAFFILGKFRLGSLIGFFPRHILVGCIGGVGWFLIETGFEVSTGMNDEGGFQYNLKTLQFLFGTEHIMGLWMSALFLAVSLRFITERFHHQLIFPIYFLLIPIGFYIIIAIAKFDMDTLRRDGWLFNVGDSHEPWWKIYTYWDLRKVNYVALLQTLPTQFALLFFNILHPPLNVPALAVSLDQEVDTNRELIAHGYSNVLAGLFGTVPNYLVYVNTVLFYRVGGGTRLAGFLLACFTAVVMVAGTTTIGYIPVMVVGALIFVLGIDLVREALWDTRHRTSKTEYVTILSIIVCMTIFDFVIGVLFGIVLACFFFVVQNSQNRSIRALYTGDTAMSTVRRPSAHRRYLQEVGRQTAIMKLHSYLFFGTITFVEETARELLDAAKWNHNPIRFLVVDLSLVLGVDLSAAEAFVRLQRLLAIKSVTLVLCGFQQDSPIRRALESVDLFEGTNVEVFSDINEAIEWTENVYLNAWFESVKEERRSPETKPIALPGRVKAAFTMGESWQQSPRRSHIHNAGGRVMQSVMHLYDDHEEENHEAPEPALTLMKTFAGYETNLTPIFFMPMLRYFTRVQIPDGAALWNRGDRPDGIYLVESGVLRAIYDWDNAAVITESMVSGTLAGEISGLSNMPRNATVVAEKFSVLWKLTNESWATFKREQPALAHRFVELVLKVAKNDYDALISACSRR